MLQIKNTLGGGKPEGLYAWKKCVGTGVVKETPSTERYYFTTSQSESVTIYYSSSYTYDDGDFVLTNPSEINIALGAYNAIEANLYFMVNTSRGNVMLKSSSGSNNQRTVIYNWESGLFAHCPDSSYPFYICNDTYEFFDYVVSDKETAYPDGGEKGGYWYERADGNNVVFGACTPSSDTYFRIEHDLGQKPDWFIIVKTDKTADGVYGASYDKDISETEVYHYSTYGKAIKTISDTGDKSTSYAFLSDSVISVPHAATSSSAGYKWSTSSVYLWACGMFE